MKHIPAILTTTLLAVAGAEAKPVKVFIRDVRKDLNAPKMPFVIGVMGVGGLKDQSTTNGNRVPLTPATTISAAPRPSR